jgi:hypothetical protein
LSRSFVFQLAEGVTPKLMHLYVSWLAALINGWVVFQKQINSWELWNGWVVF